MSFRWASLDYDPSSLNANIVPRLSRRPDTVIHLIDDGTVHGMEVDGSAKLEIICWNRGRLQSYLGDEHVAERAVNLDAYVAYPLSVAHQYDIFFADGRKRRRCLLAARRLLEAKTITILRDASRPVITAPWPLIRLVASLVMTLRIGGHGEQLLDAVPAER
jgi:hypothetical protein